MESTSAKDEPQAGQEQITKVEEAEVLRALMKQKGGKEKLMAVIKALSAMRLTKDDPTPSLVLAIQDGKPVIATNSSSNDFLFQGSVGAAFNGAKL